MSERMYKTGSGEFSCCSASGNELITFSPSEEEELMEKLSCCSPPEMVITWLRGFVTAKVKEEILLSHKKPLTSVDGNIEDVICDYKSRNLELRFSNNVCSPVLTKENIKGEDGESLQVSLFDSWTGEEVKSGPGSSERVQIVVLEGDFDGDEGDWTRQEFDKRVVGEVEGKNSLLVGNVCLYLRNGATCLTDIYFKCSSTWMKKSHFRLGARFVDTSMGIRVKEAMTKPFDVKDKRENLYKSHAIPSLCDEVWRLHMIGRNGPVHKKLVDSETNMNIKTVKDFLDLHFSNAKKLQEIFGRSARNLKDAVSHALTCPDKLMYYPSGLERKTGVVFIVSGEVLGLVLDREFASSNMLSETEKDLADTSVRYAFKHWGDVNVIPFEDQKYLARCSFQLSDNACQINHELVTPEMIRQPSICSEADINELISDDILTFNDTFCSSPYHGSETLTLESMLQNIDDIFSSIDDAQKPNQQNTDIAFCVNSAAAKAYKTWKTLLFSIRFLSRKKYSGSYRVHKKPKLY